MTTIDVFPGQGSEKKGMGAELEAFLAGVDFAPLQIPVVSNVHARPNAPGEICQNLASQMTHPLRGTESTQYLLRQPDPQIEEVGPGTVGAGLIPQIKAAA